MDHTEMETQTTEEKLNAKFETFKEGTKRMGRSYWASVRRANEQVKEIRASYTPVYECPVCGLLRPADHSKDCKDLHPADLTNDQKLFRKDFAEDWNWDYELTA
jgi:DNA repair exonuclease SbcCD ATPase subunit